MVKATVTYEDGRSETLVFHSHLDAAAWADEHHGEYTGFQFVTEKEAAK